jgi:hypothetical protein
MPNYCFIKCAKCHTSANVLYIGTGATRITLGSRQSAITPESVRRLNVFTPLLSVSILSWHPRCWGSDGGDDLKIGVGNFEQQRFHISC